MIKYNTYKTVSKINLYGDKDELLNNNDSVYKTNGSSFKNCKRVRFNLNGCFNYLNQLSNNARLMLQSSYIQTKNEVDMPLIWYKFDDSTNIGLDSMGKANMVALGGTTLPYYDDLKFIRGNGSARSVAGENKGRAIYNFSDVIDEFSISFWININLLRPQTDMVLTGNTDVKFSITRNGSSTSYLVSLFNSGYVSTLSGAWVADNIWRFITITAKQTNDNQVELNFYLNGILNKTNTSGTWNTSGLTYLQLYGWNLTFQGNLDDMRIYNKVLTQEEITLLYDRVNTPNLLCKFNNAGILINNGTNNITLTNYNGVGYANDYVMGDSSASFNGTNQYLAGTILGINNNSWSVSCWLYSKTSPASQGCVISFGGVIGTGYILFMGFQANLYYMDFFNDDCHSTTSFSNDVNNWVHIVFTYNSTTKTKQIYRNGIKLDLNNPTSSITTFIVNTDFFVSKMNYDGRYYNGYIDDLRIYTGTVLTEFEITRIYNNRSDTISSGLNQNVIVRLATSTNDNTIESINFNNRNPILAVTRTNSPAFNSMKSYQSLNIPSNFIQKGYIELEVEYPILNYDITTKEFKNLNLNLVITDEDNEQISDKHNIIDLKKMNLNIPIRYY